jgi:hypothetical protein
VKRKREGEGDEEEEEATKIGRNHLTPVPAVTQRTGRHEFSFQRTSATYERQHEKATKRGRSHNPKNGTTRIQLEMYQRHVPAPAREKMPAEAAGRSAVGVGAASGRGQGGRGWLVAGAITELER